MNPPRKPSLLLIAHTYVVHEHAKKLPELARHFDLTCVTVRPRDYGTTYGIEGQHFGGWQEPPGCKLVMLPALGRVSSVTRFILPGLTSNIRSRSWDYVLVENEPWSFLKWQTLLSCRLLGNVRHCGEFTWENVKRPGLKGAVLSLFYRATGWWSSFVIAGNQAAATLMKSHGMPPERVAVCPQVGVDTAHYRPLDAAAKAAMRAQWSLPADAFLVGFAGRFVPEKGIRDVADAVASLPSPLRGGSHGVHLAVIGHGPLREHLLGLSSSGAWMHVRDAVPHHDLPAFLQCLDLLILGSHPVNRNGECWEEQFGHILIEAIACGSVAAGSTSGAIPEVLNDAELTFAPGDIPAMRALIQRLHSDPVFLQQKRKEQRTRLEDHYTHAVVADRCAQFLLSLPGQSPKAVPASPLACIIIPVHNRKRLTLGCLEGLRWCAHDPGWRIILVDDASTDGTGEAVRSMYPHVDIVTGDGNLFWTGAIRLGMAQGVQLGCTEFVWLNDDTRPDETSLRRIAGLVRDDPQQMVASMALLDGVPQACCGLNRKRVPPVPGTRQSADVLAGYQVAFAASLVQRMGLPDSRRWPHYGGDSSYTRMAHNAGYELTVDGDSFVALCGSPKPQNVAEDFWKNDTSLRARISRVFFSKGSRYRLLSLWHLDCLYRGFAGALMVFPARLAVMLWSIISHHRSGPAHMQNSRVPG